MLDDRQPNTSTYVTLVLLLIQKHTYHIKKSEIFSLKVSYGKNKQILLSKFHIY